jgi:hydroxyacylglutathione hydrolase
MIQKTLKVGPLQCNCQVLVCPHTAAAVIIDPGDDAVSIIHAIQDLEKIYHKKVTVKALLHTHAHFDHINATRKVKEHFIQLAKEKDQPPPPQIFLHAADLEIYQNLKLQGQMFGISTDDPLPVDQFLLDEQEMRVGKLKLSVLHTPGHSPGGVCFRLHEDSDVQSTEILFTGDTLFKDSYGRTDLWGGDESELFRSIKNRILTLDGDTCVWPGHGPKSRVGDERENF